MNHRQKRLLFMRFLCFGQSILFSFLFPAELPDPRPVNFAEMRREGGGGRGGGRLWRFDPGPRSPIVSSDRSAWNPPVRSSGRGTACRAPASCSGSRTASGHCGGESCGPPPWPSYTCRSSGTPRTVGETRGIVWTPCATRFRTLCGWRTEPPPGAVVCAFHSTVFRREPAPDSRGVGTGPWVCSALLTPLDICDIMKLLSRGMVLHGKVRQG